MKRNEVLNKAEQCVCGDRDQEYGSPEDNFQRIAELWSSYTDFSFSALDVAMMMLLLKVARVSSGRIKDDNFIDLAGYAACAGEIATKETNDEFINVSKIMKEYYRCCDKSEVRNE